MDGAVAVIAGAGGALAVTPVAAVVARRLGVVAHPGPLRVHTKPVPYLGGVGIAAGLAVPVAVTRPTLLLPLALALLLGVADDIVELTPQVRLGVEAIVGVLVGIAVPAGSNRLLGIALVALATVVLINGTNIIDGLDALAATVTLVSAAALATVLGGDDRTIALALAGATVGFLAFNFPPARVFLGDGGAYLLGTALAALAASAFRHGSGVHAPIAVLLCVAYPVLELVLAVVRRRLAGQPLLKGDREHVYDRLAAATDPGVAVVTCVAVHTALALVGAFAARRSPEVATVFVLGCVIMVVVAAAAGGFLSSERR